MSGLSPLARGTLAANGPPHEKIRFIPAGAGNTAAASPALPILAVYPRWRGEHLRQHIANMGHRGLSPLARGTLTSTNAIGDFCRFIPAGAGNTAFGGLR
ncbi:hypothetical protein SEEJ1593_16124 [Salmonella enterica subsp. enterica serovar Javiana str. ATCC BAA-1593]|nr:conserved hypothetical protein [Salmonella enterica subsp. enterica serovar Javiana str. GA_MM04042433]ELX42310.1 hypothetical protein SEEJ1593_16124 [Salmonella enterica subsp. enterica serovar Javiana str. ATCC BAA-1593]